MLRNWCEECKVAQRAHAMNEPKKNIYDKIRLENVITEFISNHIARRSRVGRKFLETAIFISFSSSRDTIFLTVFYSRDIFYSGS